jgi:hypothetical protein
MSMDLIWTIIIAFGLTSLGILILCFWTYLDMQKKDRQDDHDAPAKSEPKS